MKSIIKRLEELEIRNKPAPRFTINRIIIDRAGAPLYRMEKEPGGEYRRLPLTGTERKLK